MSLHRHDHEEHDEHDHDHGAGTVRHSHAQASVDRAMEDSREGVLQLILVFVTGSVALLSACQMARTAEPAITSTAPPVRSPPSR